jgi:predicted nucleic acid-binding protein
LTGYLLDTNVVSELRRAKPNPNVVAFIAAQPEDNLFLSEVTFAEIRFGIEQLADPERRAVITAWLNTTLRPLFARRTLAVTEDVILRWRLMVEAGRRRGHTFGQPDLFIAATAAEAGLTVVTRDTTHFDAAGVPVFDPWTGQSEIVPDMDTRPR